MIKKMAIDIKDHDIYHAGMLGLRDDVHKNNFPGVLLGLSGGVDSALTLTIAVDALGAACVRAVLLPSPYTSADSIEDANQIAAILGIKLDTVPIAGMMQAGATALKPLFPDGNKGLTDENLQARLRGVLLMAISNNTGALLLTTGNKSEIAVGYSTLYGDMCGGYSVLKDLYKTQVYDLCAWRNRTLPRPDAVQMPIPQRIIDKAPSAELRPDQKDQDNLPPYPVLDTILHAYIEQRRSVDDVIASGIDVDTARQIWRLLQGSEFKRRQAAPGVKLSASSFGRDWRYPLTGKR